MQKEEMMLRDIKFEIESLEKLPVYQAFVKFQAEYNEGQIIAQLINRKKQRFNKIMGELKSRHEEPEEDDYEEEYEEERKVMPKKQQQELKRSLKNRPVSQERERELDKKVSETVENPFEAEASELGLDDDIPGLPDNLE